MRVAVFSLAFSVAIPAAAAREWSNYSSIAPLVLRRPPGALLRNGNRSRPHASDCTILLLAIDAASRGWGKLQEGPE